MKKSRLLMLLPVFLLVGCAKSINKEEAAAKAKEINEYQAAHPVTEFKFELSSSEDYNGVKEESKVAYEFSEEKVFFHVSSEEGEDKTDLYGYKNSDKYYVVNAVAKQYYEFGEEAKEQFDNAIKGQKQNIQHMFDGYAAVDIDGLLTHYVQVEGAEVEYSTKGDGQLSIEVSWKGEAEGMTGTLECKAVWEDYYPAELSFKMEGSGNGQSIKEEMSAKFEYSVSPSYPSLADFTKLN